MNEVFESLAWCAAFVIMWDYSSRDPVEEGGIWPKLYMVGLAASTLLLLLDIYKVFLA